MKTLADLIAARDAAQEQINQALRTFKIEARLCQCDLVQFKKIDLLLYERHRPGGMSRIALNNFNFKHHPVIEITI